MGQYVIRPLTGETWDALARLFGRGGASNGCWCQYWLLGPRYHDRARALNRQALESEARQADPAPGLVAFEGAGAVGWCRVGPRAALPWLDRARGLGAVDGAEVWSVPCFFVGRAHRGRGVAGELIEAAAAFARDAGAVALEAYPIDTTAPSHSRNTFSGVAATFLAHGFTEVARRRPDRPIVRLALR